MRTKAITRRDIVDILGRARVVEGMVLNISHLGRMTPELKDLSQMIYLALLEYDRRKIKRMYTDGQLLFFVARMVMNQYRSFTSPFHRTYRDFQERSVFIGFGDIGESAVDAINSNFVMPTHEHIRKPKVYEG